MTWDTDVVDGVLLDRIPPAQRSAEGVPDDATAGRRRRGAELVAEVLAPVLVTGGLRTSPLGSGWSSDVDAYVDGEPDHAALEAAGWVPLGALLARLGRSGGDRWAVVEDGEVLTAVDIHHQRPPQPVDAMLERIARRCEVRVREVLELRALVRAGHRLPDGDPTVRVAAAVEAGLGGELLADHRSGPPLPSPARLPASATATRRARAIVGRLRHRRVVVALSGVDGAGKSTLAAALVAALQAGGVPVTVVWTRPGMRLGVLAGGARLAKRLLGERPEPGIRRVAADPREAPRSRRGAVGWTWAMAVAVSFVVDVWRRHLAAQGVVVHDRHALDAVVTLDVLYAGTDLRAQRWLVRRLLPRATVHAYLDVPPEVAVARKRGDTIGESAVRRQLARYDELVATDPGIVVLPATTSPSILAGTVLAHLTGLDGDPHRRHRA